MFNVPSPSDNLNLQHNIVSLIYSLQGLAESHFSQVREGRFQKEEERLRHAEEVLKRNQTQARLALEVTKRLGRLLKKDKKVPLQYRKASLERTWQAAKTLLAKEFGLSSVEIIERIPEGFPLLRIVQGELEEIIYGIAKNAFQAMSGAQDPPARPVRKFIVRAQLGFSVREEPFAWISLVDTGPGIHQKELTHLFDPFVTTKPEGEGNGLGLFIAKELILKNGGKVTVASFENFGTTFTLELPIAPPARSVRPRS